jgi:hypothetical protein
MEDSIEPRWRTASYSTGNGGACVEIADGTPVVLVRDTKDRGGAVLSIPADVWRTFTATIR